MCDNQTKQHFVISHIITLTSTLLIALVGFISYGLKDDIKELNISIKSHIEKSHLYNQISLSDLLAKKKEKIKDGK